MTRRALMGLPANLKKRLLTFLLTGFLPWPAIFGQPTSGETIAYVNGHVWDGEQFQAGVLYVRDGRFAGPDSAADRRIDLEGGYVIPPFGDAHSHSLGAGTESVQLAGQLFLRDGIFYALDLTNPFSRIAPVRDHFLAPQTLDVAFALGGLSSSRGSPPHPAAAMEEAYGKGWSGRQPSLEGDAYWFMDSLDELAAKWPRFLGQEPDVVKVYITNYGEGGDCGGGLCPDVLKEIVRLAHLAGLQVFAHVDTAADVRLALQAGVDALAHIPLGNDGISAAQAAPYILSEESIRAVGDRRLMVTPTAHLLARELKELGGDALQPEIALQRDQLRRLQDAGGRLALGGHDWRVTSLREALYLDAYRVFDNKTILKLWTETTPQMIFPGRKISRLAEGYEASFLVLGADPLQDFSAVRDIRMRVKQGYSISP